MYYIKRGRMKDKKVKKIAIIGAGAVGSCIMYSLMLENLAEDIVLIDINDDLAQAQIYDIRHGIKDVSLSKVRCGNYEDIKDSDFIIMTAGRSRNPGETRIDMVFDNTKIAYNIAQEIKKHYTTGKIILVANPVDIITQKFSEWLDLSQGEIIGAGCLYDNSRFTATLANHFNVGIEDVETMVIGEHGESQVLLWSKVKIKGLPLEKYCEENNIVFNEEIKNQITTKVKGMGAAIIAGKGKTFWGISLCTCYLIKTLWENSKKEILLSLPLKGEYGFENVALSVPCLIDNGKIIPQQLDDLSAEEKIAFNNSEKAIREILEKLDIT